MVQQIQGSTFARGLVKDRSDRKAVGALFEALTRDALRWDDLPAELSEAMNAFEAGHIAAGYAAVLGGSADAVERRQTHLMRAVVNAILFPLQAYDDRLLALVEERGLTALFQHLVHEFTAEAADAERVFEAAEACRIASFRLEELLKVGADDGRSANDLCDGHNTIVARMWNQIDPEGVPHGWLGVALLWATSLFDLGALTNLDTTDHA